MRKVTLVFIVIVNLTLHSCWYTQHVPLKIIKEFNQCYSEKNKGLESLISINGYYKEMMVSKRRQNIFDINGNETSFSFRFDTIETKMMFFKDGTCVYEISPANNEEQNDELFFKEIIKDPLRQESFGEKNFWGLYQIDNDTILITCVQHIKAGWGPLLLFKYTYLIEDQKTIKCLKVRMYRLDEFILENLVLFRNDIYISGNDTTFYYPAKFFPLDSLPSSDCWLKKNRWFWCDEEKYNEYMLGIKKR